MNDSNVEGYLRLAFILASLGYDLAGKMKALVALLNPDHGLSDDEINQLEAQMNEVSAARKALRDQMARPSTDEPS